LTTWVNVTKHVTKDPNAVVSFGNQVWYCECKCGNLTYAKASQLVYKERKSCGCGVERYLDRKQRLIDALRKKFEARKVELAEESAAYERYAESFGYTRRATLASYGG
jgi:hypothetical protein